MYPLDILPGMLSSVSRCTCRRLVRLVPAFGAPRVRPSRAASSESAAPATSPPPAADADASAAWSVPAAASRPSYYAPSPPNAFVRRYAPLLRAVGFFSQRAEAGGASEDAFRSAEEQATAPAWGPALGLRPSWMSETALIGLHVWLFHNRYKLDYYGEGLYSGRRATEALFERLWEDCTLRIRNAGIVEVSVNKQLETVQKILLGDMMAYDAALRADVAAEEGGGEAGGGGGGGGGLLATLQHDSYYALLVPLTVPVALVAVHLSWYALKLYRHS